MPDYMVIAAFTSEPDAALLPPERERLQELADGGSLQAAYLSADRAEAWLVLRGDGSESARNTMESLPLHPYMEIRRIAEVREVSSPPVEPASRSGKRWRKLERGATVSSANAPDVSPAER